MDWLSGLLNLLVHVLGRLSAVIHEVGLLSSGRVKIRVDARLSTNDWCDDWLHALLELLLLVRLRSDGRSNELLLSHTQAHALKLVCSSLNAHELLLETLLLLGEVHVGSDQLSIQVRIHVLLELLIDLNLWWGEDLLWNRVHLTLRIHLAVNLLLLVREACLGSTI